MMSLRSLVERQNCRVLLSNAKRTDRGIEFATDTLPVSAHPTGSDGLVLLEKLVISLAFLI